MQFLQEVKFGRILFALVVTVLIADTVPHPNLRPGFVASSLNFVQEGMEGMQGQSPAVLAEKQR